jgi:hypothetical protein
MVGGVHNVTSNALQARCKGGNAGSAGNSSRRAVSLVFCHCLLVLLQDELL